MTDETKVVVEYDNLSTVNVETFFKDAIKEMLVADNDTLTLMIEVDNPDSTVTKVQFDLVIKELSNVK